jgi:hypothetical protein
MTTKFSHVFGVALAVLFVVFGLNISRSSSQDECVCSPALRPPEVPRFPPGTTVQVYIDTTTGFNPNEIAAVRAGIEDWNDENNNTDITLNVQETTNPPTLPPTSPGSYIIVISYEDRQNPDAIAGTQTFSGT